MTGAWLSEVDPPPEAFAAVMATGIVSVAADDHGYWRLSTALGILAMVGFVVLGLGFALWALRRPGHVVVVLRDPDVAMRMFTVVAACEVLGLRWGAAPAIGWLLSALALVIWLVLTPLVAVDVASRPSAQLRERAHGTWLLPSVATAGLATTAADLALDVRVPSLVLSAAVAWVVAMVLYLAVVWLIAWRALTTPLVPEEVTPDSWILMGALAITALAGDHIVAAARTLGTLSTLGKLGALAGLADWARPVTLGSWGLASLWVPVLLYAQVWRADQVAGSLRYQGVWWTAVFPLGMYAAACAATATELHLRSLGTISLVFFWDALTVWTLLAIGGLHSAIAHARR